MTRRVPRSTPADADRSLMAAALDDVVGAVLVLDAQLRIRIATPTVTYKIADALFTGDALFLEDYGTGRCDFPKGSAASLYDSIQRLYEFPDDTRVFAGHDYQPGGRHVRWQTTIGASKKKNPQLSATTTREKFIALRQARDAQLPAPRLLFPSVQVNIDGGRLPAPHPNGRRYLMVPLNVLRRADDLGRPTGGT